MDTRYLEDLMILVDCGSFGRAAKLIGITQASLARRIQSLENSFNIELIDRSNYPTQLTEQGKDFYERAIDLLRKIESLQLQTSQKQSLLRFSMPHHLAIHFFPKWFYGIQTVLGSIPSQIESMNLHDGTSNLLQGDCDFWLTYCHPAFPLHVPANRDYISLGKEVFAPYVRANWKQAPLFELLGKSHKHSEPKVPLLSYQASVYFKRVVEHALQKSKQSIELMFTSNTVESLKQWVLTGSGVAFLPQSAVQEFLDNGELMRADTQEDFSCELDIRLYRSHKHLNNTADRAANLWCYLVNKE